jgi:hypothetical protein
MLDRLGIGLQKHDLTGEFLVEDSNYAGAVAETISVRELHERSMLQDAIAVLGPPPGSPGVAPRGTARAERQ